MKASTLALTTLAWLLCPSSLPSHPADNTRLLIRIGHDHIDFRFSLNLVTLSRITQVDADNSGSITFTEIKNAVPAVTQFLSKQVLTTLNDQDTNLGDMLRHECLWPNAQTHEITPQDAGQRYVDFLFHKPWPNGVQDVWLGFQVFEQLGQTHEISAIYQQAGEQDTPVSFSASEPDYLYDTGWEAQSPAPTSRPASNAVSPSKPFPTTITALIFSAITFVLITMFRQRPWASPRASKTNKAR